jgi:1,4-dihydroxy-2-naphthoate octaprenyltransferase
MPNASNSRISAWVQASRPASNVNLIFPLLFGQAIAYSVYGIFDITLCLLILLYGWFDQMFIVFLNDYADSPTDVLNKDFNIFSGGSRVVVEGKIQRHELWRAATINALLVLTIGLIVTVLYDRIWIFPLFVIGLLLLWAYSMPPIKLNYRGGGETLQGLGCGVLLPIIGFYVQTGTFNDFPWLLLIPFFILHYSSSVATALPDFAADKQTVKHTLPVLLGRKNAAYIIALLSLVAVMATFGIVQQLDVVTIIFAIVIPSLFLLFSLFLTRTIEESPKALFLFDAAIISAGIFYALGFCVGNIVV